MIAIGRVVKAIPLVIEEGQKKIYRVIGSLDIDGKGTEHGLIDVDPFIFLDEAIMSEEGTTFKKHPHAGMAAISYILSGEIEAWDNFNGFSDRNNQAGGVYYINSGKGVVHSESGVNLKKDMHWLQLWINPGIYQHELPMASTQLVSPADIPYDHQDGFSARVLVGTFNGQTSPIATSLPMLYLHITVSANQSHCIELEELGWQGFIYITQGHGFFGQNKVAGSYQDCLVFNSNQSSTLNVTNTSEIELSFVLALGKPYRKGFSKLLGHGGAMVADTDKKARAYMETYQQDPDNFGKE